ncbi:MAG TPA: hypothetical protein VGM03_11655, partial [Phycisphaerae bacterium]
ILVPGEEPAAMVIRPGNSVTVGKGANAYHFAISQITPDWPILSEADKGAKAYAVLISVQSPKEKFIRQLLAGYPQYTEDVIPGRGRAIKELGTALVDTELQITLDYEPQDHFFVVDSQAVYVRPVGASEWIERPIERPVRYNEHLASRDDVWVPPGVEIPLRRLDTPIPAITDDDPIKNVPMRATGFLPYAEERVRWLDDGERLNPVLSATLHVEGAQARAFELVAFNSQQATAADGAIVFRWVETPEQLEAAMADPGAKSSAAPRLVVTIPGTDIRVAHEVTDVSTANPALTFSPIAGTEYSFRVQNAYGKLRIPQGEFEGREISVAVVEVRSPKGTFIRWVSNPPEFTKDFPADGTPMGHEPIALDTGIHMTYEPGSLPDVEVHAGLVIAAGPGEIGLNVKLNASGVRERHAAQVGQTVTLSNGQLRLTIDGLQTHARPQMRPTIVPLDRRDREMKDVLSMLKVELNDDRTTQSIWLPFNPYPLSNEQYEYPGRMFYAPKQIRLSDGRAYELMFSRRRVKLPYPVALENFELEQHVGGYTGSALTIRNYVSMLRFTDGTGWTNPTPISVNSPTEFGGYWYFQSQWDPPSQRSAGFNYTGLGVGNRNGVHVQLAGCAIAVTGMIFAFYVKPILKRRRQQAVRASIGVTKPDVPKEFRKKLERQTV